MISTPANHQLYSANSANRMRPHQEPLRPLKISFSWTLTRTPLLSSTFQTTRTYSVTRNSRSTVKWEKGGEYQITSIINTSIPVWDDAYDDTVVVWHWVWEIRDAIFNAQRVLIVKGGSYHCCSWIGWRLLVHTFSSSDDWWLHVDGLDFGQRVCRMNVREEFILGIRRSSFGTWFMVLSKLYIRIWNLAIGAQCRTGSINIRDLNKLSFDNLP